jgi:hypothetical protein
VQKLAKELLLSKDSEVIDRHTYMMAREASEVAVKGQGKVRRLQQKLDP